MLKQWRVALILMGVMAFGIFISACGSTDTGSSTSTPTTAASGSTPASGSTGAAAGTPGAYNCVPGTLNVTGSTALQPLVTKVAADYQTKCSGANLTIAPGGSKKGLSDAEGGAAGIGNSDVFAATTQADLVDHQVAVVVFALVVNPSAKVTTLTTAQITSIYLGKTTNWSQVGGPNQPIVVVERPASSGTRATFKKYILNNQNEAPAQAKSLTVDSTGTVLQTVEQTAGSIGYVTTGAAATEGSKVTVLSIDGNAPTAALAESNTYKFWNIEHMYTKGPATGLAQALIDYMGSDSAKQIATTLKFVSISDMTADAIKAHQPAS